jgi:hypothetical protein
MGVDAEYALGLGATGVVAGAGTGVGTAEGDSLMR